MPTAGRHGIGSARLLEGQSLISHDKAHPSENDKCLNLKACFMFEIDSKLQGIRAAVIAQRLL